MNHLESTITLKEISLVVGCSVSTVSKALNNKLDISKNTREIIQDIAKKYNYVPNNYAVALRKKKTLTISVIIPQINISFYSSFLFTIEQLAYANGYRIVIYQSFEDKYKEEEFIRTNNDGSVDGLIIITKNSLQKKFLSKENNLLLKHIQIDNKLPEKLLKDKCINSFSNLLSQVH
jgi:DNA-binding LacI/PurR family transcriptional regulator